jgi:hypothetical protein
VLACDDDFSSARALELLRVRQMPAQLAQLPAIALARGLLGLTS